MGKYEYCTHVMASGAMCGNIALEDSPFCYWHQKLRTRQRHRQELGGPVHQSANTGISLPSLDDADSIQVGIQEVAHAIIDQRIDSKRAGLLLYALQLASANAPKLSIKKAGDDSIVTIGIDDHLVDDAISPQEDEDGHDQTSAQSEPDSEHPTPEETSDNTDEDEQEEDEPHEEDEKEAEQDTTEPLQTLEATAEVAPQARKPILTEEEVNRRLAALMRRKPAQMARLLMPTLSRTKVT